MSKIEYALQKHLRSIVSMKELCRTKEDFARDKVFARIRDYFCSGKYFFHCKLTHTHTSLGILSIILPLLFK